VHSSLILGEGLGSQQHDEISSLEQESRVTDDDIEDEIEDW